MKSKLYPVVAALMGLLMMAYGCAVVGGAAAGAGTYAWSTGKLSFNTPHGVTPAHDAVLAAFNQSNITVVKDEVSTLGGTIKGVTTETGENVTIDLEPMGADVTKVDVRVGFFGDRGRSEKIAESIQRNLE
jgi:hypothetical protein